MRRSSAPQAETLSTLPTATEALGRLPFPDPQLSFAEMAELAACDCAAGQRLKELLDAVVNDPGPAKTKSRKSSAAERQEMKLGAERDDRKISKERLVKSPIVR